MNIPDNARFRGECELDEAIGPRDDDPDYYDDVLDQFRDQGRAWVGGGAAPLVLMLLVRSC